MTPSNDPSPRGPGRKRSELAWMAGLLGLVLCLLFCRSFDPSQVVFSNDGPLGGLVAELNRMPSVLAGAWHDLNWIGSQSTTPALNVTSTLRLVLGPVGFSKVFAPVAMFILGLGAWAFFRQLKLAPLACLLGGLAAALSSHFFSTACWGVASQVIAVGANFLALALLLDDSSRRRWVKVALAGFCVGLNVMEGYDIGAIFSLFVAAFVMYQAWLQPKPPGPKLIQGVSRVAAVAVCAGLIAIQTIIMLVTTQIMGVAGMEQDAASKAARWNQVVQWSLPPGELPQLFISGVFGYREDTPHNMGYFPEAFKGGNYWGAIGRDPALDEALDQFFASGKQGSPPQGGFYRLSGGGEYAGLLVLAVAIWGLVESLRGKNSAFSAWQRKQIWFWGVAALVSLLLAFGRYAPFYKLFYALPFASTIRNATKFTHPFHWSLVILFGYGMHALCRRYLEPALASSGGLRAHIRNWWAKPNRYEKGWIRFGLGVFGAGLLGWIMYASSRTRIEDRMQYTGFPDPTQAATMASFSIHSVAGFVLVLLITTALLALILTGWFAGRRARIAGILLGLLLVVDLARANLPWIIYWNYPQKYATNPVLDFLRQKPYLQRVAIFPMERFIDFNRLPPSAQPLARAYLQFYSFYHQELKQQQFQYYNIQSLDLIQMPREPLDYRAFETAMAPVPLRRWELTNTRYLLAPTAMLPILNQQIDTGRQRFRVVMSFDLAPKPGAENPTPSDQMTLVANTNGQYSVLEFTGALDRARLYSNWQVVSNDSDTLRQIAAPGFDPAQTVLVANSIPPAAQATNTTPGTVEFVSYAPKHLVVKARADRQAVLLLTDKFDPNWQVQVDGKPAALLRCNYIMQGVQIPAGEHTVEFRFAPSATWMYVTFATILIGLGLVGFLAFSGTARPPAAEPAPAGSGLVAEKKR